MLVGHEHDLSVFQAMRGEDPVSPIRSGVRPGVPETSVDLADQVEFVAAPPLTFAVIELRLDDDMGHARISTGSGVLPSRSVTLWR